jgi:hypothetical protein
MRISNAALLCIGDEYEGKAAGLYHPFMGF